MFAPLTRDFLREAHGQALPDNRIAFVLGHWSFPSKYMDAVVRTETDFDLSPFASPLEPHKPELLLLRGLRIPQGPGANGGHGQEEGEYLGLGDKFGWDGEGWHTKVGQQGTIDRYIARQIGQNDRMSSISFGWGPLLPIDYTSWDGDDRPYPSFTDPLDAYDKLFAGATLPVGSEPIDTQAMLARDKSLLDFVAGEVQTLRGRLAGTEREKLDRFTESLRAVERKLGALANAPVVQCALPAEPAAGLSDREANEASVDVAAMALACGLTHVAALSIGPDNHEQNHQDLPSVGTDNTWRLEQASRLFSRLKELGLGSSALVLYSDPCGPIHHGGYDQDYFYFLLGSLGGAIKGGRVVDVRQAYMGDLYAGVASAVGVPTTTFGDPSLCKGPLAALRG
jgi:hypothetical protein